MASRTDPARPMRNPDTVPPPPPPDDFAPRPLEDAARAVGDGEWKWCLGYVPEGPTTERRCGQPLVNGECPTCEGPSGEDVLAIDSENAGEFNRLYGIAPPLSSPRKDRGQVGPYSSSPSGGDYWMHDLTRAVERATDATDAPYPEAVLAWALSRVHGPGSAAARDQATEARHLALIATASPRLFVDLWQEAQAARFADELTARLFSADAPAHPVTVAQGLDLALCDLERICNGDGSDPRLELAEVFRTLKAAREGMA